REEELLRRVLALDESRPFAWNNLGILLARTTGDREAALDCYERAIRADSSLAEPWYNRGNVLLEKGLPDEALEDFDRAIRADPSFGWARVGKAAALLRKGDLEGAVRELQLALRADPSFAPARAMIEDLRRRAASPR
ncbi:MAG: tetratricopeptide repeat protein, partial [Candidatus Eisenbacteria bacterium]